MLRHFLLFRAASFVSTWQTHLDAERRERQRATDSVCARRPAVRQQFIDAAHRLRWQPREDILQIRVRVVSVEPCRLDQAIMIAAALWPARKLPANNQVERPTATGRIWFSIQLLSAGRRLSSMQRVSATQRFRL